MPTMAQRLLCHLQGAVHALAAQRRAPGRTALLEPQELVDELEGPFL